MARIVAHTDNTWGVVVTPDPASNDTERDYEQNMSDTVNQFNLMVFSAGGLVCPRTGDTTLAGNDEEFLQT